MPIKDPKPPGGGIALTAVLSLVGLLFSRYIPIQVGMEFLKLVAAIALIAGAIFGWVIRTTLQGYLLGFSVLTALAIFVVAGLVYWFVPVLLGAGMLSAAIITIACATAFLAMGIVFSVAGVKLSATAAPSDAPSPPAGHA